VKLARLVFAVPFDVPRRALPDTFDYLEELPPTRTLIYGDHIHLMAPVGDKVEPRAESVIDLQSW
jgi:hypothetical protein